MGKKKILVLEDEELIRSVFEICLKDNYHAEIAADGLEGIGSVLRSNFMKNPFDIILSDVDMPNLHGPGFYDAIFEGGLLGQTEFFFMSGCVRALEDQVIRINPYVIAKPFDIDRLKMLLDRIFEGTIDHDALKPKKIIYLR